jgi:hypothetical protein
VVGKWFIVRLDAFLSEDSKTLEVFDLEPFFVDTANTFLIDWPPHNTLLMCFSVVAWHIAS